MRSLLLSFLAAGAAHAAVPELLPVQGALANSAGAVDGTYALTVSLYAAASGGSALHAESHPNVVVTDGVFALTVGELTPLPVAALLAAPALWVGVKVEGEPELPRTRVGSVAYALAASRAQVAEALAGPATDLACTGCVGAEELVSGVLAPVASSGEYADLSGRPDLSVFARLAGGNVFSGLQSFTQGAVFGAASGACGPATTGRVRYDAGTGRLWLCDGTTERRFQMCSDTCAAAELVPCGAAITTACGDACAGTGSFCAGGLTCTGGTCQAPLGSGGNPAASCKAIRDAVPGALSGNYWLQAGGSPFQAVCDMARAGGGWTRLRENHAVDGRSFADTTVLNADGVSYTQILLVYRSGTAVGGAAYPGGLPASNPLGIKLAGKNWAGPTNWSGSTCSNTVDTLNATVDGTSVLVTASASALTSTFQVGILEGVFTCTTSDNSGPAYLDVYVR